MDVRGPDQDLLSLTVLVVDDNEINRLYMQHLLRKNGHTPVTAATGYEALGEVSRQHIDLILMDVQLPDMDGLAVTKAIRTGACGQTNSPEIPILALTAFAMRGDRDRCIEAGMTDYIAKPIRGPELVATITRHCQSNTGAPPTEKAREPFDLSGLTNEGRREFVTEMLGLFLELAEPKGRDLQSAIARNDLDAALTLAHDLAGMAGPIRAMRLHKNMKALQEACQAGDLATCRVHHTLANQELESVLAAVRVHPYLVKTNS
jgi:two-component system, OmpR family, response regulator